MGIDRREQALAQKRALMRLLPRVRQLAGRMVRKFPTHLDRDDAYGAAYLGLAEAFRRFDATDALAFDAYALRRVQGSLLDHLRGLDVLSRRERTRLARMNEARRKFALRTAEALSDEEIAREAGLTLTQYSLVDRAAVGRTHQVADVETPDESDTNPESLLGARRELESVSSARAKLPSSLGTVLDLYYVVGLNLREIGERLGVSEGRACQLRKQAVATMRLDLVREADGI